ncbi:MAG: cation transporter [Clostridia bacterium]|nr:cation transporter [Clostridia bacterium]MBQ8369457.1 cation transporter [Clostridia bacterium]MBQ8513723.1 cation transporter [Clostridia bacterium]
MTETLSPEKRTQIGRNAGIVGIGVNLALFGFKLAAGLLSGSVSIIADAVNNLTDAGSSILVMLGYIIAAKPADKEHPYGHARMEYLCGLFISIIVTFLGFELFRSSAESLLNTAEAAEYSPLAIVIMAAAVIAKFGLALYYRLTAKKIHSDSLKASAADSICDVCATTAVLIGIALTPVLGPKTDGVIGCIIAVYIFIMGVKLIIDSSNTLLGQAPDVELVKSIVGKLKSYNGVLGIHDLVIHSYGVDQCFASVHVEVDAEKDVLESHDMIDRIEVDIREQMGIALVVHLDPITVNDRRVDELHLAVHEIIDGLAAQYSSPISMHDFRTVFGKTHTNIIFDLAVTSEFPLANNELVNTIRGEIAQKIGTDYNVVITIDRDFMTTRY